MAVVFSLAVKKIIGTIMVGLDGTGRSSGDSGDQDASLLVLSGGVRDRGGGSDEGWLGRRRMSEGLYGSGLRGAEGGCPFEGMVELLKDMGAGDVARKARERGMNVGRRLWGVSGVGDVVCRDFEYPCEDCTAGRMCQNGSDDEEMGVEAFLRGKVRGGESEESRQGTSRVWRAMCRRILCMRGEVAVISVEQMLKHRSTESFWLAANGQVFDITTYLHKHPAGADAILRNASEDNSEDFELHSSKGQETWRRHRVGVLQSNVEISTHSDHDTYTPGVARGDCVLSKACGMDRMSDDAFALQPEETLKQLESL